MTGFCFFAAKAGRRTRKNRKPPTAPGAEAGDPANASKALRPQRPHGHPQERPVLNFLLGRASKRSAAQAAGGERRGTPGVTGAAGEEWGGATAPTQKAKAAGRAAGGETAPARRAQGRKAGTQRPKADRESEGGIYLSWSMQRYRNTMKFMYRLDEPTYELLQQLAEQYKRPRNEILTVALYQFAEHLRTKGKLLIDSGTERRVISAKANYLEQKLEFSVPESAPFAVRGCRSGIKARANARLLEAACALGAGAGGNGTQGDSCNPVRIERVFKNVSAADTASGGLDNMEKL